MSLVVPASSSRAALRLLILLAIALALSVVPLLATRSRVHAAEAPKAVIIVGPTHGATAEFLVEARLVAEQANAAGMDVTRVFHPHATWSRVKEAARGANLLVYFGHGNGWPSPYAPFQERTKNGFGLNAVDGGSTADVKYVGGDPIREQLRLAPDAVVLLYRACYAPGNGEEWQPKPSERVAVERVDNFAAAFLHDDVGGGAVFAMGTKQWIDFPARLMTGGLAMQDIMRTPSSQPGWAVSGWQGWAPSYHDSERTPGARMLLDPHPDRGYYRALSGKLNLTTGEWAGRSLGSEPADETAPRLSSLKLGTAWEGSWATAGSPPFFTPNGDGWSDRLAIRYRVSERGRLHVVIRDAAGRVVRSFWHRTAAGAGTAYWAGRDDEGHGVPQGRYTVRVTPQDRAGNTGASRSATGLALRAVSAPEMSRTLLYPNDRDALAQETELSVRVPIRATFAWRVVDRSGRIVRDVTTLRQYGAGRHAVTWDGRDSDGRLVPEGAYRVSLRVETALVTYGYRFDVHVKPFKLSAPRWAAPAGTSVRFVIDSAELLASAPTVHVKQPGLAGWSKTAEKLSDRRYAVALTFRQGGDAGDTWLRVTGRDVDGGTQQWLVRFRVR